MDNLNKSTEPEIVDDVKVLTMEKEGYFTDEMHKDIYPFQEGLKSNGYGAGKPVTKSVKLNMKKNK